MDLARRTLDGDVRALARAITLVESEDPRALSLLQEIFPKTGKAHSIGITGSPGTGKSTLADALIQHYRSRNKSVGVIAVDPTSPYSGGAILGDRIRMQSRALDPKVFIRSMATRGKLGGLARGARDSLAIMDASGREVILIETVGVGQDEVDVVKVADTNLLLLVAGMGDDVQAMKAGVMEIADVFVINKADRPGTERVEKELHVLLELAEQSDRADGWVPPIIKTVALDGTGIEELAAAVSDHRKYLDTTPEGRTRNVRSAESWLAEVLRDACLERVLNETIPSGEFQRLAEQVANRSRDPYSIGTEILSRISFS